jgi:hypothetical protein
MDPAGVRASSTRATLPPRLRPRRALIPRGRLGERVATGVPRRLAEGPGRSVGPFLRGSPGGRSRRSRPPASIPPSVSAPIAVGPRRCRPRLGMAGRPRSWRATRRTGPRPDRAARGRGGSPARFFRATRWWTRWRRKRAAPVRRARRLGDEISGTRSRRLSPAGTRAPVRSVLPARVHGPSPAASAIATSQPWSSGVSWTKRAPCIDPITAQALSPRRATSRARRASPSASGGEASTARVWPDSFLTWTSRRRLDRSRPMCNVAQGPRSAWFR